MMKAGVLILSWTAILALPVTAVVLAACAAKNRQTASLPTVRGVDLKRYSGRWHEVARLPNRFQRDDSKAIAEYTPNADGSVKVVNTELRPDGTSKQVTGKAEAVEGGGNARLRVKFEGLAALAPAAKEGNYWIIKLADDYSMALVGTPDRKFLWLLAREAEPDKGVMKGYVEEAQRLGFEVGKLVGR